MRLMTLSVCLLWGNAALAAGPYVLSDGISRAPAVTLHCKGSGNIVVPCGTAATPLVVTQGSGSATSANQQTQVTAEQATAQALGAPADAPYAGGNGSMTSVLKSVWSVLGGGVSAIPVGGVPVSRSVSVAAGQTTLFTANPMRRYLSFQVPQGSYVWINLLGGPAAPNAVDCAYFAAGTFYESGQYVNRGAISIYSPVAAVISAWEG